MDMETISSGPRRRILHSLTLDAIAAVDHPCQEEAKMAIMKRAYTADERKEMAGSGLALPDGSFPIKTVADLHGAIPAVDRADDPAKAKRHIRARAKALGADHLIPEGWPADDTAEAGDADDLGKRAAFRGKVAEIAKRDGCGRTEALKRAARENPVELAAYRKARPAEAGPADTDERGKARMAFMAHAHGIAKRDRIPLSAAMAKSRREHEAEFQAAYG